MSVWANRQSTSRTWLPVPVGMVPSLYGGAPLPTLSAITALLVVRSFEPCLALDLGIDLSDKSNFFY